MQDVRIKKHDLIGKLRENRKEHIEIYREAEAAYRNRVARLLAKVLSEINAEVETDAWVKSLKELTELSAPQTHKKNYDRALAMLEVECSDVVTLSAADFMRYVQDEWDWSRSWAVSNSHYVDSPKLRALTAMEF